jgi:Subtilase family
VRRRATAGLIVAVLAAVLTGTVDALVPSDPQAAHPTYAELNLPAAWDVTTGSPRVVVAIVDSGVDPTHPDLAGAVRPGHDFVDDDSDPADPPGPHGTAVAGVVAARANNGIGGMGTCFSCDLMSLRVLGLGDIALNTDTAAAIDYAVDHGAAVVNASLYGPGSPQRLRDAIVRARAAGVLVVAAAGNEGTDAPQYPAAFPEVISVGAAAGHELTTYSSRGEWLKFAAPECAPVTPLGGTDGVGCATSVASPLVAGVVGLLRTNAPFASADEIEEALARTARTVPGTRFGLVDAAAALAALGRPEPVLRPLVLGTPEIGRELEALSGVWAGAGVDVRFRWERCAGSCTAISGATSARYEPVRADAGARLRVTVFSPQAAPAASPRTSTVLARPLALSRPAIAGRARVGSILVARHGTWSGGDLELSVAWLRCRGTCVQVGAGGRYRLRARDRGSRLRIEVVGSNGLGQGVALSRPTSVVR